jgi:putative ABC transport system permease protein
MFRWPWKNRETIHAEVDEELRYHLDRRAEDLVAEGMTREAAERVAHREFGDLDQARRGLIRTDLGTERAGRRRLSWDDWRLDVRAAWRGILHRPGLAMAAVTTLALGTGLGTAVFSVVHGVLLRPLPYPEPERLITVWQHDVQKDLDEYPAPGTFMDWRERSRSFGGMAAAIPYGYDLLDDPSRPVGLSAWQVTEGFFEALGIPLAAGRTFTADEYRDARAAVAVLGHALWRSRYGADSSIVGRRINLDGTPHLVIGVAAATLDFPDRTDVYTPQVLSEDQRALRRQTYWRVIGRLANGVTLDQAHEEASRISADLATERPQTDAAFRIALVPLKEHLTGNVSLALYVLLAAVGLLLAIACANVASLLLAHGLARRRELAVRAALGAGRGRLARLMLLESAMLAVLGGIMGIAVAYAGVPALLRLAPTALPRAEHIRVDLPVLAAALGATILTALLCGLIPARSLTRGGEDQMFRAGGSRGDTGRRSGRALVIAEVAIALVLLVGAGLLGRSMRRLVSEDLGYDHRNRALFTLHFWDRAPTAEKRAVLLSEILRRIGEAPGVTAVGAANALPLSREGSEMDPSFRLPGEPPAEPGRERIARLTIATPDYLRAMGTRLAGGRFFSEADRAGGLAVAVVNETLARTTWPGEDPVGKQILTLGPTRALGIGVLREVVGVVGDSRQHGLGEPAQAEVYVPHAHWPLGSMTIVAHSALPVESLRQSVEAAVWSVAPALTFTLERMETLLSESLATRRLVLALMMLFAGCAGLLAAVGIAGLVSLGVSQRAREIGIRMALGAERPAVVRLVLRQGLALAVAGVAAGIVGALSLTRWLGALLYQTPTTDLLTYTGAGGLLLATAVAAAWLPARRATRVDPVTALRSE